MPLDLDRLLSVISNLETQMQQLEEKVDGVLPGLVAEAMEAVVITAAAVEECQVAHDALAEDRLAAERMRDSVRVYLKNLDGKITTIGGNLEISIGRIHETIRPLAPLIEEAQEKKKTHDALRTLWTQFKPRPRTVAIGSGIGSFAIVVAEFWEPIAKALS